MKPASGSYKFGADTECNNEFFYYFSHIFENHTYQKSIQFNVLFLMAFHIEIQNARM